MIAGYLLLGVIAVSLNTTAETTRLKSLRAEARPAAVARSAVQGNRIMGHVFDSNRTPVPRIYVELMNDYYQTLKRVQTDASGLYSFDNLSSGNFKVKVLSSGTDFVEQTQDVTITNFGRRSGTTTVMGGKDSQQVDFILRSKAETRGVATRSAPGTVFVQEVPAEAKRTYDRAVAELDKEKPKAEAIEDLKKAVELFPNYYMALERLGLEYIKRRQYEPANVVLNKAVEVYPRGYMSLYSLGYVLYNLKQYGAADEMLNRAIAVSPNSINAHLWLGIVLRFEGKLDQAEMHLKRANELGKGQIPEAHWQLALLYNQLKRSEQAADELETFLKLQPDSRDAEQIKTLIKRLREQHKQSASK